MKTDTPPYQSAAKPLKAYPSSALIIVDMQYDFMEGGALEVQGASRLLDKINTLSALEWDMVIATKDWHPSNHISFASNHQGAKIFDKIVLEDKSEQILWPQHCVQHSQGSKIHADINMSKIRHIIYKGQNAKVDSYSAFFDNHHLEKTKLDKILKDNGISHIFIVGLARDYCTFFTALDGASLGYSTHFVFDATMPVDSHSDEHIIAQLKHKNIEITNTTAVIHRMSTQNV